MVKRTSSEMQEQATQGEKTDVVPQKFPRTDEEAADESHDAQPEDDNEDLSSTDDKKKSTPSHLQIKEEVGDIFNAPDGTVIIHACNTIGSWGAGIAAAFKQNYPSAYENHYDYCKENKPVQTGTAQLIPPLDGTPKHWVGCVFTSALFGKRRDPPKTILAATGPAMVDLLRQIATAKMEGEEIGEVRICKINSGLFRVPWEKTVEVLEKIELEDGMPDTVTVWVQG
jgi:ADP-ribose 1''-phosphate phosphatase